MLLRTCSSGGSHYFAANRAHEDWTLSTSLLHHGESGWGGTATGGRVPCGWFLLLQSAVVMMHGDVVVLLSVTPGASSAGKALGMRLAVAWSSSIRQGGGRLLYATAVMCVACSPSHAHNAKGGRGRRVVRVRSESEASLDEAGNRAIGGVEHMRERQPRGGAGMYRPDMLICSAREGAHESCELRCLPVGVSMLQRLCEDRSTSCAHERG